MISNFLADEPSLCTYEQVKAAENVCQFVKENCAEVAETINLLNIRFCQIGGEGRGGEFGFYIVLVCKKTKTRFLRLGTDGYVSVLHAFESG